MRGHQIVIEINHGGYMKKSFMCSLCHHGLLGGGLYLDSESVTYRTQKLTVHEKYRNLVLPLSEIENLTWKWWLFPVATFHMKNGEIYQIMTFHKSRFLRYYREYEKMKS